jgi:hypothetical protein
MECTFSPMGAPDLEITPYFYDSKRQFRNDRQNNAVYCRACVNYSVSIIQHEELEQHTEVDAVGLSLPELRSETEIREEGRPSQCNCFCKGLTQMLVLLSDTKGRMPLNRCRHPVQMLPSKPKDMYLHLVACPHITSAVKTWANNRCIEKKYKFRGPPRSAHTPPPDSLDIPPPPEAQVSSSPFRMAATGATPFLQTSRARVWEPDPRTLGRPLSTGACRAHNVVYSPDPRTLGRPPGVRVSILATRGAAGAYSPRVRVGHTTWRASAGAHAGATGRASAIAEARRRPMWRYRPQRAPLSAQSSTSTMTDSE